MWIKLAIAALLLSGCVNGKWTREDTYRQAALTAAMTVDYAQTMRIAREPDKYHERNPIMGAHPSELQVTGYFIGAYALTTLTAMAMPEPYREYFQYVVIGVEGAAIANNLSIGLGFGF
jgi:hypothetical protein